MFIFRLLSTISLIGIFLASIFLDNNTGYIIFSILTLMLVFLGINELCNMLKNIQKPTYSTLTSIVSIVFITLFLLQGSEVKLSIDYFVGVLAFFSVVCWITLLFSQQKQVFLDKIINSTGVFLLFCIPLIFIIKIYCESNLYNGKLYILFFVLVTKSGDIGAYATGTLSNLITKGKNIPIVPNISPKKSYQGTVGGLLTSISISFLLDYCLNLNISFTYILIIGVVLFIGGFYGDLVESSLKRITKVKDSGHIIPGIGGVLDLVDSFLLTAPIFYFLLRISQ